MSLYNFKSLSDEIFLSPTHVRKGNKEQTSFLLASLYNNKGTGGGLALYCSMKIDGRANGFTESNPLGLGNFLFALMIFPHPSNWVYAAKDVASESPTMQSLTCQGAIFFCLQMVALTTNCSASQCPRVITETAHALVVIGQLPHASA